MKDANIFLPLISLDPRQAVVLIELIQKDAYNQGVIDSADNAKLKHINACSGNCGEYDESYDIVDKESILKLIKK